MKGRIISEDVINKIIIHNLYVISGTDLIAWMMKSMDIDDQGKKNLLSQFISIFNYLFMAYEYIGMLI